MTPLRTGEARIHLRANRKTLGAIPGGGVRVDAAAQTMAVENPVQRIYAGSGKPAGFSGHVVARVDARFEATGTWSGVELRPGATSTDGNGLPFGAYARSRAKAGQALIVRVGT